MVALVWLSALDRTSNPMFHPHGYCYLWEPSLVGAHVISDGLIGLSYVAISVTLAYLFYRVRQGIPFSWMFLIFGAFIVACGATHFMEIVTLWSALFWSSAAVKIVTAVASVGAAVTLPPLVPRVIVLLDAARRSEERRVALELANATLEARVAERTAALEALTLREQQQRREAEAANRAKDEFLGLLSHELRTPMNAVIGWATTLSTGSVRPETRERALQSLLRSARMQERLVEDLLDVAMLGSGKLHIDKEPTDMATLVRDAAELVASAAEGKGIRLRVDEGPAGVQVLGDPRRLRQVVWNLLSNAVKFTPEGGRVDVRVEATPDQVRVIVTDTGIGIDPAFLPRMFDRFAQQDSSHTRRYSGLGIGLALVRELIQLHGGTVSGASAGEGRGSEFVVDLPRLEQARA